MATSSEIAQQISDQNNWFLQQQAMSAQAGVNPLAYGGGMGGWGTSPMMGQPAMPVAPGQHMPGAFNYGGAYGYGVGNRANAMMAGAASATPFIGSMLGGTSPMFNPASGYMAARAAGLGMGASLGAAGLMAAPVAIAAHGMTSFATGMHQQALANTAVGNYNFANPASMTGAGFSRQDAAQIGSRIRQLQMIPELMTSFEEVTRILPQLKQAGVMQGVRDANEFGRRMKEAITTVRDISRVIGSTMEEATQFFAHSQRVGFFGRKDQLVNAMNTRVTQSMTGMTQEQVMAMQEQGAAFGTAIGGSRRLGAQAVTNIAQRLGAAVRGNVGLQETIANITGKVGEEGIGDAAGMLANFGMRVAGSGPGRFMLAGMMKVGPNGEVGIDEDLMRQHLAGNLSMDDIRQRGRQMMGNRKNVIAFERHQTKLGQQFASMGGGEAMLQLLQGALGTDTEAAGYILQSQYGASEEQADLITSLLKENGAGVGEERRAVAEMVKRQAMRREYGSAQGIGKRLSKRLQNSLMEPLREAGAEFSTGIGTYIEEILADVQNDAIITATKSAREEFRTAMASGDLKRLAKVSAGPQLGGGGSLTSRASGWLRSTEFGAFVMRGDNDTGRTEAAQLDRYKEMLGVTSAEGVNSRAAWLQKGNMAIVGESETHGRDAAARIINELYESKEFRDATDTKKFEMAREAVQGDARTQDALSSIQRRLSRRDANGVETQIMDAATYLLGAGNKAAGGVLDMQGALQREVKALDVNTVNKNLRDAQSDLRRLFGSEGAGAMSANSNIREAVTQAFAGGPNGAAVRDALRKKDSAALRRATGGKVSLSGDEWDIVNAALDKESSFTLRWGESTKDVLGRAGAAFSDADNLAFQGALKDMASDVAGAAGTSKGPLSSVLSSLSDSLSKGDAGGAMQSLDKAVSAYNSLSKADQKSTLGGLPSIVRAAIEQRQTTSKNLQGLVGKGSATVAELMEKTGLGADTIARLTGVGGAKDIVGLDASVVEKLTQASGRDVLGRTAAATSSASMKEAKEKEQIVLFRTMTSALLGIADHFNVKVDERTNYTANRDAINGKSPQNGKGS